MGTIQDLLSQFSIESIILFSIGLVVAFKFISELWDWGYGRIKKHFNIQSEKQRQETEEKEKAASLEAKIDDFIDTMYKRHDELDSTIQKLTEQQEHTVDRLQENTRSFIIDKHHYFCYQLGAIDDMNLQSLERRYMYYKSDGGNSFIDQLMEEIRHLPRVNLQDRIRQAERDEIQ